MVPRVGADADHKIAPSKVKIVCGTNRGLRMARRSAPPPRPKSPNLTVGQKRRRIERLQKCVTSLEAFDPHKARKRAPAVLALEAAIDKALSSAFGYGTPAYLRYNQAATLDPSPLLTNATLGRPVPVGGPGRHDAKAQEVRQHFSENKEQSISLLRKAISTLEEEIADAEPIVAAVKKSEARTPIIDAEQESKAAQMPKVRTQSRGGIALKAATGLVGRWWRGRN
jgi:hypothetical protein